MLEEVKFGLKNKIHYATLGYITLETVSYAFNGHLRARKWSEDDLRKLLGGSLKQRENGPDPGLQPFVYPAKPP